MPASDIYVLGLTGGIGCGKSEAATCLRGLGAAHIDADAISRSITAAGGSALPAIREAFGSGVFESDGTLSRPALSKIVFSDETARKRLESVTHPAILAEMQKQTASAAEVGAKVAVWDVPLLFETGMDRYCAGVWVLTAPEEIQMERVMFRGLSEEAARARVHSQMPTAEKIRRATRVIDTNRPIPETHTHIRKLYAQLLQRL